MVEVCSRNVSHAECLAEQVGALAVARLDRMDKNVDFCIVAVDDDALPSVASQLRMPQSKVIHTSGATEAGVLSEVSSHYGVLWSPMSFVRQETMNYAAIPFCVEGSDEATAASVEALARRVSPLVYRLDARQRCWAHLAAVLANNFGNALFAEVQRLSRLHHFPYELLQPIILQTAQRSGRDNLWTCQTGPAIRRDRATLQAHRNLLSGDVQLLELYDFFTRLIAERTEME